MKIVPSQLDSFFWSRTHNDIQIILKVSVGHECAVLAQGYENLAQVVSSALGGETETKKADQPKDKNQALAMFNAVF